MTVRPATADDVAAIAAVHVRSWQGAYRGVLAQEFLDAMDVERPIPGWQRQVAAAQWPRSGVLVATEDDVVVGFVDIRPSRDEDDDPDKVGEVTTIYVLPDQFGQGVGRELMRSALASLTAAGYAEATLWVLAENRRAIGFYERGGWQADGSRKDEQVAGVPMTEVRYRLALPR